MPDLLEITVCMQGLERTILGETLRKVRVSSPSILRTWDLQLSAAEGRRFRGLSRNGKRVVWEMGASSYGSIS